MKKLYVFTMYHNYNYNHVYFSADRIESVYRRIICDDLLFYNCQIEDLFPEEIKSLVERYGVASIYDVVEKDLLKPEDLDFIPDHMLISVIEKANGNGGLELYIREEEIIEL